MESYWESVFVQASVTVLVALGLNLQIGYVGIYLAAPAALYCVGAYGAALAAIHLTHSFLLVVLIAIACCAAVGTVFGAVAARIRGEYFIIASLALGFVLTGLSSQLNYLGRSEGLVGIPINSLFGHDLIGNQTFSEIGLAALVVAIAVFVLLVNSTVGRRWRAVMNDESAARSLGLHPTRLRIGASAVSGIFFGLAGAIYAANIQFVSGADFGANESFLLIVAVIVGGAGTVWGPVLGGLIVSAISGGLAQVHFPPRYAGVIPEITYGVILVAILVGAPSGLVRLRFGRSSGPRDDRRRTLRGRANIAIGRPAPDTAAHATPGRNERDEHSVGRPV